MQLFIILALLLYGGSSGAQNLLSEVKPVLEAVGGEDMKTALKSAEEISEVITAVQGVASVMQSGQAFSNSSGADGFAESYNPQPAINFPLAPVANIADRDITFSLSKYISQN
ncbi:MAG: hypothetical protein K2K28_04820 [Clostridia bacterium]|nr:hypothetical protein [Clostridia bacterium]